MAKPAQALPRTPTNCGGLRRMPERGTGVVSGISTFGDPGVAAAGRVFLHEASGALRGFRRTGVDGAYSFIGLPVGPYRIVTEDDSKQQWRSTVDHTEVT